MDENEEERDDENAGAEDNEGDNEENWDEDDIRQNEDENEGSGEPFGVEGVDNDLLAAEETKRSRRSVKQNEWESDDKDDDNDSDDGDEENSEDDENDNEWEKRGGLKRLRRFVKQNNDDLKENLDKEIGEDINHKDIKFFKKLFRAFA